MDRPPDRRVCDERGKFSLTRPKGYLPEPNLPEPIDKAPRKGTLPLLISDSPSRTRMDAVNRIRNLGYAVEIRIGKCDFGRVFR